MGAPAIQTETTVEQQLPILSQAVVQSLLHSIKEKTHLSPTAGQHASKNRETQDRIDILLSAALIGNEMMIQLSLCFGKEIFMLFMEKMLDQKVSQITPEMENRGKHFLDKICKETQKQWLARGVEAVRSIPQIVTGDQLTLSYLTRGETRVVPINLDPFNVEITLQDVSVSDNI